MSPEATKVGTRVMVDPMKHPLPLEFLNRPLEIESIDGEGEARALVRLKGPKGIVKIGGITELFRPSEFLPAPANLEPRELPRIVEKEQQMSLADQVLNLTKDYEKKYNLTAAEATKRAGAALLTTPEKQRTYLGHSVAREPLRSPDVNQARAELEHVKNERGCSADEAADVIVTGVTANRFKDRVMNLRSSGLDPTTALMMAQREDPVGATAWREAGVN